MPWSFHFVGIPSFVGIHGMFTYIFYVLFIETDHFGRQRKNSHPIDLFMGIKPPGKCWTAPIDQAAKN